ncbi:hypothetical protein K432DRAFT_454415 [Lepidopterella palustris CBS 459.81]|uniref:Uncharacterized protein n=1 Tax=Lepidopterella palustris CBS 459.81 TaxID=1314670 RepID=A0A8E2DW92_9PEZI|nr:hypothetical protein K432DRAFT_454415 [Lepidopterella palustris CBS 459.81]
MSIRLSNRVCFYQSVSNCQIPAHGRPEGIELYPFPSDPEVVSRNIPLYILDPTHLQNPHLPLPTRPRSFGFKKPFSLPPLFIIALTVFLIATIATIATLIGGLVGISIERASVASTLKQQHQSASQTMLPSSLPTPAPATPSSTTTAIAIPSTGRPTLSNHTLLSPNANISYTLFGATNWIGFDIAATTAVTLSACVEACSTVNYDRVMNQAAGTPGCLGVT